MKRLVLIMGLVLLLALAACNGGQPTDQELLPTDVAPAEATMPAEEAPAEGGTAPETETGGQVIPTLAGTSWEWVDLTTPVETISAVDPARYTITFNEDGTANITADCNSVIATYVADATGAIAITTGPSTLVACPEDTQDQLFLGALTAAANYFAFEGGADLFIDQIADAGTLRFQPAAGAAEGEGETTAPVGALTGVTWEWVSLDDPMGQTAATDPTRYTITFNEDGTAAIQADCNSVRGNYIAQDSNISLEIGPSTLMACPEDTQDFLFTSSLANATTYTVEDGELFIELQADAGTLIFRQSGTAVGESEGGVAAAPALTGTRWEWVSTTTATETITAADPARYAITFADDGSAGVVADCNVGNATYTTGEGNVLSIVLGVSTLVLCENSQDQQFRAGLEGAASYALEGGELVVTLADGGMMRFRAGAETQAETSPAGPTLTGQTWQWVATVTPVETITAVDPTRYTITFNEDGTASIKADCNQVTATYTAAADTTIAITLGASTLAMCPSDSQDTLFINGLGAAAIYFFVDDNLFIDQFASAGTMEFAPAMTEGGGMGSKGETGTGEFVGTTWQWTALNTPASSTTVNNPSAFTITFNADGTANFQADCNVGTATYTTGETANGLTITPGAMTAAQCSGNLDQIFLGGLTNAMSYRLEGGELIIDMLYESGSLVFSPAS